MNNTHVEVSFNDIPQTLVLLLNGQKNLEEKVQALHHLYSLHRVENRHKPMSVQQVHEYTDIPVSTIYQMLEKGEMPGCKYGKRWQIFQDELDRTIEAHRVNSAPLTAEEQNADILASHRRKPRSIGKYGKEVMA